MTTLNEFPVEVINDNSLGDKLTYRHASFGMINISRIHGGSGINLFGAEKNDSLFSIKINNAEASYGLGRVWNHSRGVVSEIMMNSFQFSELFTTNGSVVPCTIRYREDVGHVRDPLEDNVKKETDPLQLNVEGLKEFKNTVAGFENSIHAIITKKGPKKKADKEEVIRLTRELDVYVNKFAEAIKNNCLEAIDKVQENANNAIQEHINRKIEEVTSGRDGVVDESHRLT